MTRLRGSFEYFTSYRLLPEVTIVHCPDLIRLVRWSWFRSSQEGKHVLGKTLYIDWRWPWE